MKSAEIRELQSKFGVETSVYWMMEIAATLNDIKRSFQASARDRGEGERPPLPRVPKGKRGKMSKEEQLERRRAVYRIKKELGVVSPSSDRRTWYAVEYVPSLPVKLDIVTRNKPREGYQHEIVADTRADAERLLIERLTNERKAAELAVAAEQFIGNSESEA